MQRLLLTGIGLACFASVAGAYSHFIHYTGRSVPFNPVPEKFDLTTLPNKTVTFLVSDSTPARISKTDQYPSVLSAIREAARVWNGVDSSDLRVAFGGIAASDAPQDSPGADVVFEEMDPLLLGLTSTNVTNSFSFQTSGLFVPIRRPVVRLNRDLSAWTTGSSGPSFTEAFFLTVVHEMGHALGLQHTFTASAMSTEITRATSLAAPITNDDIAGLSYLYPARTFGQATGSISGRVTFSNGQGVHLASVVAIRPTGGAISALTDPDGRYRIDGVLPGSYYVYVHPLPPPRRTGATPGDMALPIDPDGRPVPGDGPFDTLFYQGSGAVGTRDYQQAQTVNVGAASLADNVSFSTNRRNSYGPITAVTTYSYYDQTPVRPGYLNTTGTLVAVGAGLLTGNAITPGLTVNFLGGTPILLPAGGMLAYSGSLVLYLSLTSTFGGVGPRAIVFSTADDIYVLPSGLNMVQRRPPFMSAVTAVTESGTRAVAIEGTTLSSDTRFYFDGVPASLLRFDDAGRAIVALPAGLAGVHPTITAFNPDGQNSMFLQASAAPSYTYDAGDPGFVTLSPGLLPAGVESLVEITGGNGSFVDGITKVGFGSSDVQVRRTWVVGPNKVLANVWIAPNAAPLPVTASVITGFQVISQASALQVTPANSKSPALNSQLVNAAPPIEGVFPGATAILSGANLSGGTLTLGDRAVTVLSSSATQITLVIPSDLTPGPVILKFSNGADSASIVIVITAPPPDIRSVSGLGNVTIDTNHPARAGDTLNLLVLNLVDAGTTPDLARIRITIGGVDHAVRNVTPQAQGHLVQVIMSQQVAAGLVPTIVTADGRSSLPYSLPFNP